MLTRRELLQRSLQAAPLLALGGSAPQFLIRTARAAASAKPNDTILVVVELAGGNDGLNMVVPYGDDLYHKARPTLRIAKDDVIRIDDHMGLNPTLKPLEKLLSDQQLAMVQGVGYPNPNRSHFESMDIWHTADPRGRSRAGWLGQAISLLPAAEGKIPAMNLEDGKLPLALQGAPTAVPTVSLRQPFELQLGEANPDEVTPGIAATTYPTATTDAPPFPPNGQLRKEIPAPPPPLGRNKIIRDLTDASPNTPGSMMQFVRRTSLGAFATVDRLKEVVAGARAGGNADPADLAGKLQIVARMIQAELGARIYFVSFGSFDTHTDQRRDQDALLGRLAAALQQFFDALRSSGEADRVALLTFSEFGRRVRENNSQGTDHGAASTLFLAGPRVRGGLVGPPPNLADLDDGDIKFQTDFRQVYATVLEDWLRCESRPVLGRQFAKLPLFK